MEVLLTFEQVCERIHLTPATARTYRSLGKVGKVPPFKRVGKKLLILQSELDKWMVETYGRQQ